MSERQKGERERCTLSWVQRVYLFFVFLDIMYIQVKSVLRVRSHSCTNKRHDGPLFPTTSHLKAMCHEKKRKEKRKLAKSKYVQS